MTTESEPRIGAAVHLYHEQAWPKLRAKVKPAAWIKLGRLEESARIMGVASFRFPPLVGSGWRDELILLHESYDHWGKQDTEYKHNGFIYRMRFGPSQPSEPLPGRNAAAHMLSIGGVS